MFFNGQTPQEETKSEPTPTPPPISNRTTQHVANNQMNFDPFGLME